MIGSFSRHGGVWCECELCRKRCPPGETNISDRVVDFANRVGKIVEKDFPEVLIAHYIYAEYVNSPKKHMPRDNRRG